MKPSSKIVGVRWVETDKGVPGKPKVRSRLVAQEFATEADPMGELFAPTPPLAATRWIMSGAASRGKHGPGEERLMLLDFKKAFLYADIERELYIELPEEDEDREGGANVGLLNKAMYGTRDAAQNWEHEYTEFLEDIGFQRCEAFPCCFYHAAKGIRLVVHGDDFTSRGFDEALTWMEADMMKRFDHRNIVKLLGVCTRNEPVYAVMEYMLYGDLKT